MTVLLLAMALLAGFGLLLLSRLVLEDVTQVLVALQRRWRRRGRWLPRPGSQSTSSTFRAGRP